MGSLDSGSRRAHTGLAGYDSQRTSSWISRKRKTTDAKSVQGQAVARSFIASSHAGHAGSTCFGANTSSTLKKLLSSKPLSSATRLTYSPRPEA